MMSYDHTIILSNHSWIACFSLSCVIVTASSSVIYMYGYQKFMAFLTQEREKQAIQL